MIKYFILFLVYFATSVFPQQYSIKGKVTDFKTNKPLSFANIRVEGTTLGTAANVNGEFELKLASGNYKIIASYIGYYSDTSFVNLTANFSDKIFKLRETEIFLPEVVIKPGVNPALEIIRKAIEKSKVREQNLYAYEFEAFTKGIIRTTEDISASGSGSVSLGLGGSDTTELKITGILENHSRGFYNKPDQYKEIILARKQSANFPPSINTLTGGRLIQNFYSNTINFLGRDLPGPISDDAIAYYYYYIERVLAINNQKVFQIYMEPENSSDPGFVGRVFIKDSTYDLIKVDFILNRAANIGGIFDTVNVVQQFDQYKEIYMPVDYRLFVKANLLGLARLGFELNTILFDYKINETISEDTFDKAIVTVLPEADVKDSL